MDMSSMNMGSMDMTTTSASMSMTSGAAMASDSSANDMGGMDMSSMNEYLTTKYNGYPVLFKTLKASSGGVAFGIFVLIFFTCFAFRGFSFLGAYLEQRVFHNYSNSVIVEKDDCACDPASDSDQKYPGASDSTLPEHVHKSFGTILRELLFPGMNELGKDIIRLLLAFVVAMLGYALMLVAMSFVLLYFFAICAGLAFSEVFFNRLGIVLEINRAIGPCTSLH
ncbi:DEKNAAC100506 [Brettanomyces naardenensis]|uniref:Copper transport protein n=1 Tax=Brettanomyces naardenensis TaxID=13370 RepID=A0A448YET6_BRENA|nr:DEKNAAC100506 [Brettanomyces naardenensis]